MVALSLLPKPIVTIALWSCIALSDDSIKLAEFTLSGQKTIQRRQATANDTHIHVSSDTRLLRNAKNAGGSCGVVLVIWNDVGRTDRKGQI